MRDFKDYKASENLGSKIVVLIGLVGLLALLGWMGDLDHQYRLEHVSQAARCE